MIEIAALEGKSISEVKQCLDRAVRTLGASSLEDALHSPDYMNACAKQKVSRR